MASAKYEDTVRSLEDVFKFATTLSNNTHGRRVDSRREETASHVFTKICLHVLAILKLTHKSKYFDTSGEMSAWDYTSVAVLTRAVIEAYYTFYYLVVDGVEGAEVDFRFLLWDYHSENRRLEQLILIGSRNPELQNIKKNVGEIRRRIEESSKFQSLERGLQKKILKGDVRLLLSNIVVAEKAGINRNYHKAVYIYLSSYIHTYPFSVSQIAALNGDKTKMLELAKPILDYCTGYSCFAIRDFVESFPDQKVYLVTAIRERIGLWEQIFNTIGNQPLNQQF